MRRIVWFEPWFFLLFGLFHLHRIWALIDPSAYAGFWLGVLERRGAIYYVLLSLLLILCFAGLAVFWRQRRQQGCWWRWFYLFGGGYVLFDLFAIVTGLPFWRGLLYWMFDAGAPYWIPLWSCFILLGAASLLLGVFLLRRSRRGL